MFHLSCMDFKHNFKFKIFILPLECVGTVSAYMEAVKQADTHYWFLHIPIEG